MIDFFLSKQKQIYVTVITQKIPAQLGKNRFAIFYEIKKC